MSANAAPAPAAVALRERRPPLGRLVGVELRKMHDTRAGLWLLVVIGLAIVAITTLFVLFAEPEEVSFAETLRVIQWPLAFLLPVLAILSVTSEWSQRTALSTFTLIPDRSRVMAAKAVAILLLAVAALAVTVAAAALGNLAPRGGDWSLSLTTLGELLVFQVAGLAIGFAFGLVLQSSAPAIVLYYVIPIMFSILVSVISALEDVGKWLDTGQALEVLVDPGGLDGTQWGRVGTSMALWFGVPLIAGLWRLSRSELK